VSSCEPLAYVLRDSLHILLENQKTTLIFKVNGWTHPLVPGISPVLEAGNGAFMFPDAYSSESGAAVGVVITDDSVYNIDGAAHSQLSELLLELTALQKEKLLPEDQVNRLKVFVKFRVFLKYIFGFSV